MDLLPLATGFFLGVRHCLEPDHLTAVAHFASAAPTPRRGLRAGLLWGVGHGVSVLVLGLLLSALQLRVAGFEPLAERAVGATLIALSIWRLRSLLRRPHVHAHRHESGIVHSHPHGHAGDHLHTHAPTLTGLVHGAAGAVGVVALLTLTAPAGSIALVAAAFCLGTFVAMGAAGWMAARFYVDVAAAGWERIAIATTGVCGFVLGVVWIALA
jgi:hypothetical protein